MKKVSFQSLFCLLSCLFFSIEGEAWGKRYMVDQETAPPKVDLSNFYLENSSAEWWVKETYLLMQPNESDISYATRYAANNKTTDADAAKVKRKKPSFDWSSGARLSFGHFLYHHDKWDISFAMTYLYGTAESKTQANLAGAENIVATWSTPILGQNVVKSSASWKMNYFVWDTLLGRHYSLLSTFRVHPFLGVRAALIDIDYTSKYKNQIVYDQGLPNLPLIVYTKPHLRVSNDFWGIGPRIGSDFTWDMSKEWSLLGTISAALLYSYYSTEESMHGFNTVLGPLTISPFVLKAKDNNNTLRTNLEGNVGIQWARWVRNDKVRIATSFLFEASQWFAMNQLFHLEEGAHLSVALNQLLINQPNKHHGNLSLIGISLNLQVDF